MLTVLESVKSRYSVRTFKDQSLTQEDMDYCQKVLTDANEAIGPFGNKVTFMLVDKDPNNSGKAVGTYGIIKNPQKYIVSIVENKREALIDLGYLFEAIVIKLFQKGIGSCWLGGTFQREMFLKAMDLNDKEIIPAVIPIGYPADNQRAFEKMMRFAVNANNKKPWGTLFFDKSMEPLAEGSIGKLEVAFEAVRTGPSASNKQPWRLVYDNSKKRIHHYLALDPKYAGNRLGFTIQYIDSGIALYQFYATAQFLGLKGKWTNDKTFKNAKANALEYIKSWKIED